MGFHVRWCNGSTEVFGAFSRGSNPRRTASQHYAPPMLPDGPEMRANHPIPRWRETNSGRGLPHSKTLRVHQDRRGVRQLLDCATPLALLERRVADDSRASFAGRAGGARRTAAEDCRTPRRFAFTKTGGKCASFWTAPASGAVGEASDRRPQGKLCWACRWRETNSGRGLPHSKTLRVHQDRRGVRQLLDCATPLARLERKVADAR